MSNKFCITQNLIDLRNALGWPIDEIEHDGFLYDLGYVAQEFEDAAWGELGDEATNPDVAWPIDPAIADIIRKCIADYQSSYASEQLAYLLLRCGYTDNFVIDALDPWKKLTFDWQARNLTIAQLESLLSEAEVPRKIPSELASLLTSWIEKPLLQFSECRCFEVTILNALLGDRVEHFSLDSEDRDQEAKFFSSLLTKLDPRCGITNVDQFFCDFQENKASIPDFLQSYMDNNFPNWESCVHFSYQGENFAFPVSLGARLNDRDILANVDSFMKMLDRPERAFRIDFDRDNWQDAGAYVVGNPLQMPKVFQALGITLLSATPSSHATIDFGLGSEPFAYVGSPQIAPIG